MNFLNIMVLNAIPALIVMMIKLIKLETASQTELF